MRNIRKAVVRVLLVFVLMVALQGMVRFCYESWSAITIWSKQERKELDGTLDTLYCGTSLAYYAFNPEILDAELGTSGFNLGTSAQPYIGTYYLIQEAVEKNPIKQVYLSVSLPSLLKQEIYTHNYVSAFENMNSWKWKLAYLTAVNKEEVWIASLLYSTQVDNYLDTSTVKTNIEKKLFGAEAPKGYGGRGYRVTNAVFKGRDREENLEVNTWYEDQDESRIVTESITYLEKIVEFCKENEIELTLIGLPYTQLFIDGGGDMDGFHRYMTGKAEEWGVDFYNFVLYKDRINLFTDETFKDGQHLNYTGGERFSYALAEVMQSDDPASYFYDSLEEFE